MSAEEPVAGRTCPLCGASAPTDSNFCEACGKPLGGTPETSTGPGPTGETALTVGKVEAGPIDDLGEGPISAPTHPSRSTGRSFGPPAGPRPCLSCGGKVGPEGYCESCGIKTLSERDHFREQPASWVAGVCDKGISHPRNEDAMALLASATPGERAVLVVLDGVSSSVDSDVSSLAGARAARVSLRARLPRGLGTPDSRRAAVSKAFADAAKAADDAVIATTDPASTNPASATFAAAVLEQGTLAFGNVGDSRVYWLPDGRPGVQLTVDDSAAQALIAAGVPRAQAETSPQAHAITKWLGRDSPDATPRVGELQVTGPGWVLACSDGLWNYASEPEQLSATITATGTSDPAALALALVAFANGRGGQDNITVALARVEAVEPGHNAASTPPPEQGPAPRESDG